ncbi:MAG: YihY/virulence factor BrkB family protein [Blastocatellia bacterium]|nr:YihY/virulence factor BrkB family protein [Blastocatellia bacterium]
MGNRFFAGLTLKELALGAWRGAEKDHAFGRAAELAYYFLLALFPMLIFLTSLVGFMPGLQENIINAAARFAPVEVVTLVRQFIIDVVENRSGGLISFGILGTLWAASTGVASIVSALDAAFDATDRPYWKTRAIAAGLTIALSLLVAGGTALIMFTRYTGGWLASLLGIGSAFATLWSMVSYLFGCALLLFGIEIIYYFGPNVKKRWRWITPGALFVTVAFIVTSELFSLYLRFAPSYSATYGSLGAVIIMMIWLYLVGLLLIFGGEIDSEIRVARISKEEAERVSPA